MLMQDVELKNKEFIEKFNRLSEAVGRVIEEGKEDIVKRIAQKLYDNSPDGRRAANKDDIWVSSPHYDILPDSLDIGNLYDPTGIEYLELMRDLAAGRKELLHHKSETCGWPNKEPFLALDDFNHYPELRALFDKHKVWEYAKDVSFTLLGGSAMALFAVYPPSSYIPWHHNGNAPGYNILAHYSWGGDGYFCTYHEGDIVKYPDKDREWCVRVGRYLDTYGDAAGHVKGTDIPYADPDNASWHAARTNDWRMTISTILNYEESWLDLIDEMESE